MKYILDSTNYIEEISFGASIICNNNTCTEYEGNLPSGYASLEEWADNANIRAYYLVNGNLTYDSVKDTALQEEWEEETEENAPATQGDLVLKQDVLTAGDNITIVNNVISATGGGGGSVYWNADQSIIEWG